MSGYYSQIIIITGINILLAMGLNLITGYTGQLSLGHATFMGIGAYTSSLLTKAGLPFYISLLAGVLIASLFGLAIGMPTLRLRGDYLAIATLGFGEIVRTFLNNLSITGGPNGIRAIPLKTDLTTVIILTAVCFYLLYRLQSSRLGKVMRAIGQDEIASEATGVNSSYYKIMAFVIGAGLAGMAGGLYAHYFRYINPANFTFNKSIEILCMVVLGGLGNPFGPVVGGVIISILPEALRNISPVVSQYRMVLYGVILIVMMIIRPQGILGGNGLFINANRKGNFKIFRSVKGAVKNADS
ncbi:MAG: branched-chain amino acid ABC transporter permease [Thermoanaerobacteraceae bacterium]|nr:branched-chain amino acid ABC transporter permease [Thermoanaerobacteraceae bacterium]